MGAKGYSGFSKAKAKGKTALRKAITDALEQTDGNVIKAAGLLGVKPPNLYVQAKLAGIDVTELADKVRAKIQARPQ